MASTQPQSQQPNKDTLIAIKIYFDGSTRRFKLPMGDLTPAVLPNKLRLILGINNEEQVIFKRYSDSASGYVTLDNDNVSVWKSLNRAAKAKLKLRINATLPNKPIPATARPMQEPPALPPMPKPTTEMPNHVGESSSAAENRRSSGLPVPDFRRQLTQLIERHRPTDEREFAFRMKQPAAPIAFPFTSWSVYCNSCDMVMENEHYHCSVCDNGDYDLCDTCVANGVHCPGEGHWLIKRFVTNGNVINSMTRTVPPKPAKVEIEPCKEMPGAFTEEKQSPAEVKQPKIEEPQPSPESHSTFAAPVDTRTCNNCIREFPEHVFVTCTDCADFDLCEDCHLDNFHGHHPGHIFEPVDAKKASSKVKTLCRENRAIKHDAICDGCDKVIYGVRNKCLNCPDWDYCSDCVKNAHTIHPMHRFAKVYDKLPDPRQSCVRHTGIFCDGPLCKDKTRSYIEGVRYKCAVCHDTDFCGNCEASPVNRHNRTHPLIKFKTPVRNVSVTTMNEDREGCALATLGDKSPTSRSMATETVPVAPVVQNAASPVQTVYETKPSAEASSSKGNSKIDIKDLLTGNEQDPLQKLREQVSRVAVLEPSTPNAVPTSDLHAIYVRDTIADGTEVSADQRFIQTWTLRNPGPHAWPVGCSVRFVGGDHMLNVATLSGTDYNRATESNIATKAVQPGEEADFRVLMKAPSRNGAAISYWRLKDAEGQAFGHKLWCHVIVKDSVAELPLPDVHRPNRYSPQPGTYHIQDVSKPDDWVPSWPRMSPAQQESLRQFNSAPPVQRFEAYQKYVAEVRRRFAAANAQQQGVNADGAATEAAKNEVDETKVEGVEEPKEESIEKTNDGKAPTEEEPKPDASGMIFPTLEKESPVTSIHEAGSTTAAPVAVQEAAGPAITSPLPSTVAASEAESELFEDAETVDFIDSASDSEGFVTDEEWDVLGASDEETM